MDIKFFLIEIPSIFLHYTILDLYLFDIISFNMKKIQKSIIFDMDGTLINSGNIIANTINHVRTNTGLKAMEKDYLLQNINNPHINSAEFFYETDNFTDLHTELFETYYEEHCISDIVLYDGIANLLETLKDEFIFTIATNASTVFAIEMTKHLNINHYFKDIIGADKVVQAKPHPDMLNALINKHHFDRNYTILVGDSHKDLISANSANIDSILVNWGFTDHEDNAIETVLELQNKLLEWKDD